MFTIWRGLDLNQELLALNLALVLMAYALYDCRQLLSMNNTIACQIVNHL